MTAHADILDQPEPLKGYFVGSIVFHLAVLGGAILYAWMTERGPSFGAPNAGGAAVGIEAVNSIPLPHQGEPNPVANDSKSEAPQQPAPAKRERVKREAPPKDAIPLKSKAAKLRPQPPTPPRFKSFDQVDPNRMTSTVPQAVSNPIFQQMPGAGRIGIGNTTLGKGLAAYAALIQQQIAQHWRTGDIDASVRSAPIVTVSFDLMRDGTIRNVKLVQSSQITALDFSARRAVEEANPLPPIPQGQGFDRSSANIECSFELKR